MASDNKDDVSELKEIKQSLDEIRQRLDGPQEVRAVNIDEAARLLSCSPDHISRAAKKGKIRFIFPLGLKRISMATLVRMTLAPEDNLKEPTVRGHNYDAKAEAAESKRRRKAKR